MKTKLTMSTAGHCTLTHLLGIGMLIIGGITFGFAGPSVEAATVSLAWDPPASNANGTAVTGLAGYRLYYGTASHQYSNSVTLGLSQTVTLTTLQEGIPYFFAVVAYTSAGSESLYSEELTWTALNLSIANKGTGTGSAGFVVQWTSAPGAYYTVLRSTNLMATAAFNTLAMHIPGSGAVTSYTDTGATAKGPYFYKVQIE